MKNHVERSVAVEVADVDPRPRDTAEAPAAEVDAMHGDQYRLAVMRRADTESFIGGSDYDPAVSRKSPECNILVAGARRAFLDDRALRIVPHFGLDRRNKAEHSRRRQGRPPRY